jgi:PKD repeat protein
MNVTVLDATPPVAKAGPDISIDQHQDVQFDGTGSRDNVGVAGWNWTFMYEDIAETLAGATPVFRFDDAGQFIVTLTVTDAAGNRAMDEVIVEVRDTTSPTADAGEDIMIDQRQEARFNGTGSTDNIGIAGWKWTFQVGIGQITLNGPTPTYVLGTPGRYEVTLTVNDLAGNSNSTKVIVVVRDIYPPSAIGPENITIKTGQSAVFNDKGSTDNVGVVNWTWSFTYKGRAILLYGSETSFTFEKEGKYEVKFKVRDAAGLEDTHALTVTVKRTANTTELPLWGIIVSVIVMLIVVTAVIKRKKA